MEVAQCTPAKQMARQKISHLSLSFFPEFLFHVVNGNSLESGN